MRKVILCAVAASAALWLMTCDDEEGDADADSDADGDGDGDTDADADGDGDGDGDGDSDADADEAGDADADSDSGGEFPDETTTGPPSGLSLTATGPITADTAGEVIEAVDVDGDITVTAADVTVRNCRITVSDAYWGVIIREEGSLTIEDCEIVGSGSSGQGIFNPYTRPLVVRRVDISAFADGVMTDVGEIVDSYIHDLQGPPDSHHDGIQNGGGGPLTVRHNTILNPHDETSAIALFQDFGVPHDVLVEDNLLAGGGYTVYGGAGSSGTPTNIQFIGNVFSRRIHDNGGFWGPVAYWDGSGEGNEWRDNVWEDTGDEVTP